MLFTQRAAVLLLCSLTLTMHAFLWDFWGPIAESLKYLFGWGDETIALLGNYGSFVPLVLTVPAGYFIDYLGIRKTTIVAFTCLFFACLIRCFETKSPLVNTVIVHISAFMTALPGVFSFTLPALLSALWFPANERVFASTFGAIMNEFGVVFSFLIGSNVVTEPSETQRLSNRTKHTIEQQYLNYTRSVTVFLLVVTIASAVWLPAKPRNPPSRTSVATRVNFWSGFRQVVKLPNFWLLLGTFSLDFGLYPGILPILNLFLHSLGINQVQAGYIGFAATSLSAISGILIGYVAGLLKQDKVILLLLHLLCVASAVMLICEMLQATALGLYFVATAVILFGIGSASMFGLCIELVAEAVYPVSEQTAVALLATGGCAVGALFLAIPMLKLHTWIWVPWTILALRLIGAVLVLLLRPEYRKQETDGNGNARNGEIEQHELLKKGSHMPATLA